MESEEDGWLIYKCTRCKVMVRVQFVPETPDTNEKIDFFNDDSKCPNCKAQLIFNGKRWECKECGFSYT